MSRVSKHSPAEPMCQALLSARPQRDRAMRTESAVAAPESSEASTKSGKPEEKKVRGHSPASPQQAPLAIWGGVECTLNRVNDRFFDQLVRTGQDARSGDLERIQALGINTLRYPA